MVFELSTRSQFPEQTVKNIVKAALQNEALMARFRYEQFVNECQRFEQKYRMATEEFLTRFEAGELGDAEEFFDWFASARGRDVWEQKAQVLGEVTA
jgi:hypothetical protein